MQSCKQAHPSEQAADYQDVSSCCSARSYGSIHENWTGNIVEDV